MMTAESADTKVCPYCAETIKAAAIVCRYCGKDLQEKPAQAPSPPQAAQPPIAAAPPRRALPIVFKRHPATMVIDPIAKSQQSLTVYADRVVWKEGVLRKAEIVIPLAQVTDVRVQQSITGRAAGYGDLTIQTAGSSRAEIVAEGMPDPKAIRDLILSLKSGGG